MQVPRCGEKAQGSQRPASLPAGWERRTGLWVGLRLGAEPRLSRGHRVHALGTLPGLCMGGESAARWLRSIKKLTLLLPLCAVRTQVRLFLEELHFPEHPASRYSLVTSSQSISGMPETKLGLKRTEASCLFHRELFLCLQGGRLRPAGLARHRNGGPWV